MKLTNKHNLPATFVNILKRDKYSKGKSDISATELISPPRLVQLRKKHWESLEEDVSDRIWAIFGTAIHAVLEHGKEDHHVIEQRLHAELDGWHISGAIDLQREDDDGIVVADYKTTGAWSVMNDKKDWEYQLNIYAWLVEKVRKVPVKSLEIVAIIRDWSRRDAQVREGYPETPVKVLDIPMWTFEEREDFVKKRIKLHSDASFFAEIGQDLPLCTPEDMWEKQSIYAVRKIGNKRAKAICNSLEEAQAMAEELGKDYEVEVRPGERTRCANFCQVRDFCNQWKEYQASKGE